MLPAGHITVGDVLVILCSLFLCVFLAVHPFAAEQGEFCVLTGEHTNVRYSLDEEREIVIESGGYTLTVTIGDGAAAVTASDCPDQVCVHTGQVSKNGQAAVCVPAGVVLQIAGEGTDEEDFRVG